MFHWGRGPFLAVVATLVLLFASLPGSASAAPYSAIVMDMRNGEVLHSRNADRRQHPASLTKMMTLYLTFEAVRDGRLKLDQRVRVSRHAARQPASKLYLKSGQRVTIRSLIRATAIKSANDAAMVLAEAIGGSQKAFARMMTRRARALGMKNTTFKNPHGLTARGHLSTARDMGILGRHLFFDFPEYYNIFSRKTTHAAGKRIWTTNRLLSNYRGADGIKTGYTRAAGYNLVASAHRGGKRVIAVIFGGRSSKQRNAKMARLLDMGFSRAPRHAARVAPRMRSVLVANSPLPPAKPVTDPTGLAALREVIGPASAAASVRPVSLSPFAPTMARTPLPRPGDTLIGAGPRRRPLVPKNQGDDDRNALFVPGAVLAPAGWAVEIGSFDSEGTAASQLIRMPIDDVPGLAAADVQIAELTQNDGAAVYTVRMSGLSRGAAQTACRRVALVGVGCDPIAPVSN